MKQKLTTILCCLLLFVFGCRKKEKPKESIWRVNRDVFTGIPEVTESRVIASLSINSNQNGFYVFFFTGSLPKDGTWSISSSASQDPSHAYLTFYYKGIFYLYSPYENTVLNAAEFNNKAHYTLPPSWFLNYDDHSDSVLISGDFYEP